MQVIITFLTVLEMMKTGKIEVEQDAVFSEIRITAKEGAEEENSPAKEKNPDDQTEMEKAAGA